MQVQIKLLSGEILTVDVLPLGNRDINGLAVSLSVAEHFQISFFLLSLFNDREEILEPDDKVSDGDIFYAFIRDDDHIYEKWEEEQDLPQELE